MDKKENGRRAWIKTLKPDTVVWEVILACNMGCIRFNYRDAFDIPATRNN